MNILVLHGMGEEKNWVSSWEDIELMFPKYDKCNNYLIHNCYLTLPKCIKSYDFDGVIMMSTFIDWVKRYQNGDSWLKQYEFLNKTKAFKVVFSQDDYWLSEVRDLFYTSIGVNLLFPVCPPSTWMELYPNYMSSSGKSILGYTIYLTEQMINLSNLSIPWENREQDIVYRASGIPTFPNKLGYIKANIGESFKLALGLNHNLKLDISTSKESFISGNRWYSFIANSKSILGSNSGSSVNVRNHSIINQLNQFKKVSPFANIHEIEQNVLEERDINKNYTGISPRNIEAAMLGTLQILVPGDYGGILKPYKHYIPMNEDLSNIHEILDILKDKERCLKITTDCRDAVLSTKSLYAENVITDVLHQIKNNSIFEENNNLDLFEALLIRYNRDLMVFKLIYKLKKSILSIIRLFE